MDTPESTFVLLVPTKPWRGGLKLEIKEWSELIGMMADYKLVTGAETTDQCTQIEADDRLGSLSSKATQTTSLQRGVISSQTQVRAKDLFKSGAVSNGSAQTNPADFLLPVKQDKFTSCDISLMAKKYKPGKTVNVQKKTVKTEMRNFDVNVNMNIVRPIQRHVDYTEVKGKVEPKLGCQGGSKIKRLTLEDYKERRRALFECSKKHNEEKGSQTEEHHRMLFKAQMDFVDCHLKRLKNLIMRILHERPSKYFGFASEYITHITYITRQLTSKDLALVMSRDKEKVDEMKENRYWVWTSEELPSDRFRNGSDVRNDQLKSSAIEESHEERMSVSCSYIRDGREGMRAEGGIDPQPFDKRRDEEHRRESDFSTESELRNHIGNSLFRPKVECNGRNEYPSRQPPLHKETESSNRSVGVANGKGSSSEIPTDERQDREPNQINYQECEPIPCSGNSRAEERSRCLDPRRPRDRPNLAKKHYQGRTAFSKPVEDRWVSSELHELHQYFSGDRPPELNSQKVPFSSDSPTPVKENRGDSPDCSRSREEHERINSETERPRESLGRDDERPSDDTNVQNARNGYRRDEHKPCHNRIDRFENGEIDGSGRKSGSLRRVRSPIPRTGKPSLQRKYSRRDGARSPPSKVPRQGNQSYRPADPRKHATPTKFRTRVKNFEVMGKRSLPKFEATGKRSSPNFKALGKRSSPNFEALGKRSSPNFLALCKRSSPNSEALGKRCSPNSEALGKRCSPNFESLGKRSSPNFEALGKRSSPNFEALGKRSSPNLEAMDKRKSPPMDSMLKREPRNQSTEKDSSPTARPERKSPPNDAMLKREPRNQCREKESSPTARPQQEAPEFSLECSMSGNEQDESTDSDQFPFSVPN